MYCCWGNGAKPLFTYTGIAFDATPVIPGLSTVTCAVKTAATSAAVIDAVSCVRLTNVVGRLDPFHCTTDPVLKPAPLRTRVNPLLPTVTTPGDADCKLGTGGVTVRTNALEGVVPGLLTLTATGPGVTRSEA